MSIFHAFVSDIVAPHSRFYQGAYGRLFPNLPPHQPTQAELVALAEQMVTDDGKEDNERIPVAYTYFGQFITHDITFDPTSNLMRLNDPNRLYNFRTPRLDLDSLYGAGPDVAPYLYDSDKYGYFLLGKGRNAVGTPTAEDDLPRNEQGTAVIGDPRNDENIIISQLQLTFIKFHNKVMDYVHNELGIQEKQAAFALAQKLVRWHYQWVVIHDYAPLIAGEKRVKRLFPTPSQDAFWQRRGEFRMAFYHWKEQPFIPLEFSAAAFRFGHSMIRPLYSLNDELDALRARIGRRPLAVFGENGDPLDDLRGGRFLPSKWTIQWDRFLHFPESQTAPQFSQKITEQLALTLGQIPNLDPTNLALRDLLRGVSMGLPSGQDIARAMSLTPTVNPHGHDALWFYILREAAVAGGTKLGAVGGNIVAEVLVGLWLGDPLSFINIEPEWQPLRHFLAPGSERFELKDIVHFAGMPITADQIP